MGAIMYYLYKITNLLSGKVYIGQSTKETERWRQHKYFARKKPIQYIHLAMAKYGVDNFTYEVIATCTTQENTDETEATLITQYDSRNKDHGYNIDPGGEFAWNRGLQKEQQPMYGKHHSEESKKKISESNMGKIMPPHTDEWKQDMSKRRRGVPKSKEWIEKRAGENHPLAKLSYDLADQIRKEYATGNFTLKELSKKYDVSIATLSRTIRKKQWYK
jgi:group I intron endonuclease